MKRYIVCLLVLLLFVGSASAEIIREQLAAPAHLQTVFTSNTGKTEITVDAVVEVPEVSRIPVIAVMPHTFTTAELLQMADAFVGSYNAPALTVEELLAKGPQQGVNQVEWRIRTEQKGFLFYQWYNYQNVPTYCRVDGYERGQENVNLGHWPDPYTPCSAPENIRQQALTLAQSIAPHMSLAAEGLVTSVSMENGPVYQFVFTRTVNGIPTAYTNNGCFAADNAAAVYSDKQFPYEALWIVITPEGKVKFSMISPYQLGEVSTENTELLHFEAIMNVARATLPLSLQYKERYLEVRGQDKVRYTVDRITFGYTRVKQRNNPDECMLVPCWDFFNAEQPDESLLTINAIDGTVIDRCYGY